MVINFNKKRRKIALGALLGIIIICIFIFEKDSEPRDAINLLNMSSRNNYIIDVVFDDKDKLLRCNQNITYINNSDEILDKLYFHIYPNAFSDKKFAPFEQQEMKNAYPNGFDKGYINIENILNNKSKLSYNIIGEKKDVLEVILDKPLETNNKYSIDMKYTVKLPNCVGRFGYGEDTVNITNWFPIACVYDGKWNTESYETIGDPFYSDMGNFTVNILLPKKYEIATTGALVNTKEAENKKLCRLQAENVRDFAIVLSDKFYVNKSVYGNTSIISYTLNKKLATEANKIAKQSIKVFSELFGEYPYETYSVVASDFFIGGMEYPNLVMVDKRIYNKSELFLLEYVIAHETAHQWWYGVIGNDEVNEPWIDEALTEYSTVLYFEKVYGQEMAKKLIRTMEIQSDKYKGSNMCRSVKSFRNSQEYSVSVYTKGAVIFNEIRRLSGDRLFFNTLKEYYKLYSFENVDSLEFIEFWKEKGIDIEKIIDKYS